MAEINLNSKTIKKRSVKFILLTVLLSFVFAITTFAYTSDNNLNQNPFFGISTYATIPINGISVYTTNNSSPVSDVSFSQGRICDYATLSDSSLWQGLSLPLRSPTITSNANYTGYLYDFIASGSYIGFEDGEVPSLYDRFLAEGQVDTLGYYIYSGYNDNSQDQPYGSNYKRLHFGNGSVVTVDSFLYDVSLYRDNVDLGFNLFYDTNNNNTVNNASDPANGYIKYLNDVYDTLYSEHPFPYGVNLYDTLKERWELYLYGGQNPSSAYNNIFVYPSYFEDFAVLANAFRQFPVSVSATITYTSEEGSYITEDVNYYPQLDVDSYFLGGIYEPLGQYINCSPPGTTYEDSKRVIGISFNPIGEILEHSSYAKYLDYENYPVVHISGLTIDTRPYDLRGIHRSAVFYQPDDSVFGNGNYFSYQSIDIDPLTYNNEGATDYGYEPVGIYSAHYTCPAPIVSVITQPSVRLYSFSLARNWNLNYKTPYLACQSTLAEEFSGFVNVVEVVEFESPLEFVTDLIGGFINIEIFPNMTIGGILLVVFSLGIVFVVLRFYRGG